jgi:hypothetical protein
MTGVSGHRFISGWFVAWSVAEWWSRVPLPKIGTELDQLREQVRHAAFPEEA